MATLCTLILPKVPHTRRRTTARAVLLTRDYKMKVPYELKQGQSGLFYKLPSGLNMVVLFQKGLQCSDPDEERSTENPPLVFVHGSLLGQGESDSPAAAVAGTLQTHAGDIADFIHKEIKLPPVLLGHSFGGLIVQYYIANIKSEAVKGSDSEMKSLFPNLAGAVLAAKAFQTSLPLCKETFFSAAMEDQLVLRYQQLMTESSRMPLFDLRKLNTSLPFLDNFGKSNLLRTALNLRTWRDSMKQEGSMASRQSVLKELLMI
ncbi:hypothetical protein K7X08_018463 [Anisodus acutangulus]|uniref:AB hydrolase-1 domain-containing protein n=1 Tax=Anisodus acutangulus TaxID=402998 RepID=A0A9Q1R958_9SOLA|nr:hypothetical protein K7X08_018463 [Anisodus acutangulus]